ncbi:MAG: hypothetical protein JSS02_30030 [Planctomycetes bacterium]|nr:hypothetical protein [Planctomycetota bacterium]
MLSTVAPCPAQTTSGADDPPSGTSDSSATSKPADTPTSKTSPKGNSGSIGPGFDIRFLEGPDGRPVAVPDKIQLEEFLKWRTEQDSRDGPPPAAVSSLFFDGVVAEDRVLLTAQVEIVVTRESGWQRLSIGMSEATLRDAPTYKGPGRALPGGLNADGNHTWWIQGKGTHVLTLPLSVPILKLATRNGIQLSLPTTAARSKLVLKIDSPHISVKVPETSTLKTKPAAQSTEVEVIGLGNRLDLVWQVLPDAQPTDTALEVTTSVVATVIDVQTVNIESTQRIQSLGQQGTFEELRVALPAGYELLRLEGKELKDHHLDPANPQQMLVTLKRPTTGPIDLKWTLSRAESLVIGTPFTLEGFDVERARLQTGYLAVVVPGDFRVIPEEDKFLQRIDLGDLPGTMRQVPAKLAYRFLNRLLLRLKLQHIEPYITVEPSIMLHFTADAAECECSYRLQVVRGSISAFRLRWPQWKQQGWIVTDTELPSNLEISTATTADDTDSLQFVFLEPTRGAPEIRFRARRPIVGAGEPFVISFPVSDSVRAPATKLATVTAENVEVALRPTEGTMVPSLVDSPTRFPLPREWQSLPRTDYRLETVRPELLVALSVHTRKIQGTTELAAGIRGGVVTTRQKFLFDIAYERVSQLRFSVPEGTSGDQFKFFSGNERKLNSVAIPASNGSLAEIRVTLEAPSIGHVEIEAQHTSPESKATAADPTTRLLIPVLKSLDVEISEAQLTIQDSAARDAVVEGSGWHRRLSPDGSFVWTTNTLPTPLSVTLSRNFARPHRMQAPKALIRSVITAGGIIENRAQYRLSEGVSQIQVTLPRELRTSDIEFWWNRNELAVTPELVADSGMIRYDILLPERSGSSDRVLTINYRSRIGTASRLGSAYRLIAPHLPDDLRLGQVYWDVELPYQEHLFTVPEGYASAFRWEFGRTLWSRHPEMSDQELQAWFGTASGPAPPTIRPGDNHYLFASTGAAPDLEFHSLRKWSLTLLGAGFALVLGLLVTRWPAARHPAVLLASVFFVALLAVWYAEPVLVLLQPALLGSVLAMLASGFQSLQLRSRQRVLLSLGPASGLSVPAASQPKMQAVAIGSNEQTSVRLQAELAPAPERGSSQMSGRLSETGSHT